MACSLHQPRSDHRNARSRVTVHRLHDHSDARSAPVSPSTGRRFCGFVSMLTLGLSAPAPDDIVQETMLRAFTTVRETGIQHYSTRAWLMHGLHALWLSTPTGPAKAPGEGRAGLPSCPRRRPAPDRQLDEVIVRTAIALLPSRSARY